jgi:hypothetical protein
MPRLRIWPLLIGLAATNLCLAIPSAAGWVQLADTSPVRDLADAIGVDRYFDAIAKDGIAYTLEKAKKEYQLPEQKLAELSKTLSKAAQKYRVDFHDQFLERASKALTPADQKAIVAFYNTEAGQKLATVTPQLFGLLDIQTREFALFLSAVARERIETLK